MFDPVFEVLVLAGIALFVLARLYMALGRGEEQRPADRVKPGSPATEQISADLPDLHRERDRVRSDAPIFTGPAASGMEDIHKRDPSFTEPSFLRGAKAAYQLIVAAFARGDRDALRPLLDDDVYEAWDSAIAEREASGEGAYELLRIKRAEIESAWMDDKMARVAVRYEAQLGNGEITRVAKEIWTFMRDVTSADPNWQLDDVEVAN